MPVVNHSVLNFRCFFSLFSPVFSSTIFSRDGNKLLFSKQSEFRTLHSAATCLFKCTSDWYLNMDKGQYTAMVFVDLKKAFDTVNHEILLKKLKKYGSSVLRMHGSHLIYVKECSFVE